METFSDLINAQTPVLVDFFAEWCTPCKTMTSVLRQVKDLQEDNLRIIKVDVDKNPGVAVHYTVQAVPTLMIFKQGRQMWRQSGVIDATELNRIVEMFK